MKVMINESQFIRMVNNLNKKNIKLFEYEMSKNFDKINLNNTKNISYKDIEDKAKDFWFKEEFRVAWPSYYLNAFRNGMLDELFPFEKERRTELKQKNIDNAIEIAKSYQSKTEMAKSKDSKYHALLKKSGLLNTVFSDKTNLFKSLGEKYINEILTEMGLDFTYDKSHGDCKGEEILRKGKNGLYYPYCSSYRFDFIIPYNDKNKQIINNLPKNGIMIEFDGEYHFFDKRKNRREGDSFQNDVNRDIRKNEYCIKNNIKLIRIPYTSNGQQIKNDIDNSLKSNDMFVLTGNYPKLGWNK